MAGAADNGADRYLGSNLLVFDPSVDGQKIVSALGKGNNGKGVGWQRFVKRGNHTLKKSAFEICYVEDCELVEPGSLEAEQLKDMNYLAVKVNCFNTKFQQGKLAMAAAVAAAKAQQGGAGAGSRDIRRYFPRE